MWPESEEIRALILDFYSAFEKRSPGRQMRPINAPGDPEPHHRWSGWRLVNSPKFRCWHSSSIVFKLFIGCPNQNYYKIMYTHYLSSWIYKLSLFFGGGLFQGIQFAISLSLSFVWISTFVMTGHPGLGWATQPPALGGPYGDQGFWFFKSTASMPIEHRDWNVAKSASRSLSTSRVLTALRRIEGTCSLLAMN